MGKIDELLKSYGDFHRNPRNELMHFIGIPTVALSTFIMLNWIRFENVPVGFGTLLAVGILIYYFTLDRDLSFVVLLFSLPLILLSEIFATLPFNISLVIGLSTFVVGWMFQLLGHRFEKNVPALITNLHHILAAPLFLANKLLKKRTA